MAGIVLPGREIGRTALLQLQQKIRGEALPARTLFAPHRLSLRRSFDYFAVDDPVVAQALTYIRTATAKHLNIVALCKASGTQRRSLERRFRRYLGRGLAQSLRMEIFARARSELRHSEMTLEALASKFGYCNYANFSRAFQDDMGITPRAFRKGYRSPISEE